METVTDSVLAARDGVVGRIRLNRPAAMNAITVDLGLELESALRALGNDPGINVIVIRGAGGNFCVGGDFTEVERLRADGPAALRPLFENFGRACDLIARLDVPVVAVVEGYAMAGGFELLLAADVVLVRDDAKLADNHSNFGQIPGGGSSQRLPRLVGSQRAMGLILSGDRLNGPEAVAWGLAYRSIAAAEFEVEVAEFVDRLTKKNRAAMVATKQLVGAGARLTLSEGLALERRTVVEFISSDASAAGIAQFKSRGA